MANSVSVLTTNERTRVALGGIRSTGVVMHAWGSGKTHTMASMLVALLDDLDRPNVRYELEQVIERVKGELPVVLMSNRAAPRSAAAFQWLTHLTSLVDHEVYIAPDATAVGRMIFARKAKAAESLIASATVEDGKLIVWSCEPRRYAVPISEVPPLAKLSRAVLTDFEVNESGSRICWMSGDVDLDLDGIRAYADPDIRQRIEEQRREDAVRYAAAIRDYRKECGLKQTDIRGLSERQVRRLETGATLPHSSTLRKLATAHGMSVDDYLRELAKRSSRRVSKPGSRKARSAHGQAARHRADRARR